MDEISTWLMLSFYKTEISKIEFSTLLSRHTPTDGGMDLYLICLILFCSLINLTLLNISIYSAYNNNNNLNWLHMMGLLFHLHFLSSDSALIQNQLTGYAEVL